MHDVFYNELDPYAAQWLRNLAAAGHLPAGHVDERSILDLDPADLDGYRQCHFFAGIGGWPYALDLAGWPHDREVWTGSCPCQPLSSAGQRRGHADERHLWPAFYALIAECRPATVFGEQVASKDGREWLAGIRADLEHLGYAVGAADLSAAGVGAPHIRQRLFWVADAERNRHGSCDEFMEGAGSQVSANGQAIGCGPGRGGLADAEHAIGWPLGQHRGDGRDGADGGRQEAHGKPRARGEVRGLGDAAGGRCEKSPKRNQRAQPERSASFGTDALRSNPRDRGLGDADSQREGSISGIRRRQDAEPARNLWSDAVWLPCLDGRARRVEPGIFPLAHGVSGRVGRLRAYGNAVVPQVAAAFVRAYGEAT